MNKFAAIQQFLTELKEPKYRFKQIIKAVCREGQHNFSDISTIPLVLREKLSRKFTGILSLTLLKEVKSQKAVKMLFQLEDGERIEAVEIESRNKDRKWKTLCVSSQVGCGLGCKFCVTGQIGLKRNLTVDEIVSQILFCAKDNIQNIVFMGMGEALANPNIYEALELIINPDYLGFGQRKITVSTIGLIPNLNKFIRLFPQINLAFSLLTPFQKEREQLTPIAKEFSIEKIMAWFDRYLENHHRKVFLVYPLFKGVNDSDKHLKALIALIKKRSYLYHVNLLAYNQSKVGGLEFLPPSPAKIRRFAKGLIEGGINCTFRQSPGADIEAACGQLAAEYRIK